MIHYTLSLLLLVHRLSPLPTTRTQFLLERLNDRNFTSELTLLTLSLDTLIDFLLVGCLYFLFTFPGLELHRVFLIFFSDHPDLVSLVPHHHLF